MPDGKRLWRTDKGDLVEDGHEDAVTLAYGVDDELAESDKGKARKATTSSTEGKKTPPAANKKSPAPANKGK
jgi:hypothetical protein